MTAPLPSNSSLYLKTETLTIMLVDLVGSTELISGASRTQVLELMEDATLPIRQTVTEYEGEIIKFTGDGYLAYFRSASQALYAAAKIIEVMTSQPTLPIGRQLEGCRVVLNTADMIHHENDLLGEGVVIAARLEKHVPTNEVYLTQTVRDVAKSSEFEFDLIGEFPLKGIINPVTVFRLQTQPLSGVEHGVFLCLTDLLGMSRYMTEVHISLANRVMQRWIDLHREAVTKAGGRLRAIVGDNMITTYATADSAVAGLLNLHKLVNQHNMEPDGMPIFQYSAIISQGDLFVLSFGVNGPLIGHVFRQMETLTPGFKVLEKPVFEALTYQQDSFVPLNGDRDEMLYVLASTDSDGHSLD